MKDLAQGMKILHISHLPCLVFRENMAQMQLGSVLSAFLDDQNTAASS